MRNKNTKKFTAMVPFMTLLCCVSVYLCLLFVSQEDEMAENVNSEQDELEPIDAMEGSFLDVSRTEEVETCSQRQNRCFTCDHCHKSFRKKYNLNRHVQTHTNDIKYKCVSCNQYFQTEEKREAHICQRSTMTKIPCVIFSC